MKRIGIALALTFAAANLHAAGGLLYVHTARGASEVELGGVKSAAKAGMSGAAEAAKISSGKSVFAVLSNKTAFLLDENSALEIGKFEQASPFKDDLSNESESTMSTCEMTLEKGALHVRTPQLRPTSSLKIKTPEAELEAESRGFSVSTNGGKTEVLPVEGALVVKTKNGKTDIVKTGQRAIVDGGKITIAYARVSDIETEKNRISQCKFAADTTLFKCGEKISAGRAVKKSFFGYGTNFD